MLLLVDLEATCWEGRLASTGERQTTNDMEIIEFGCVLAERDGTVLESASFFVRPVVNPQLSDFCQSLTGITQADVDQAPLYAEAVDKIDWWLSGRLEGLVWCSWGNYDRYQIKAEQRRHAHTPVFMAVPHLNLKRLWRRTTKQLRKNGLAWALEYHGLQFEGRHHRGVDDARNIARLLPYMDWAQIDELLHAPGMG